MKHYHWTGTSNDKILKGELSAVNIHYAKAMLNQQNIKIFMIKRKYRIFQHGRTQKQSDFIYLLKQLSSLLKSGLPIFDAINIVGNTANKRIKNAANKIYEKLNRGEKLSQAFNNIADEISCQLISMGELTGKLELMLDYAVNIQSSHEQLIRQTKRALFYPAIVSLFACLVSVLLLKLVVPQFSALFLEQNVPLPLPTKIIILISNHLYDVLFPMIAIFIVIFLALVNSIKLRISLKKQLLNLMNRLPLTKPIVMSAELARLSIVLKITVDAGMPIVTALKQSIELLTLHSLKIQLHQSILRLTAGEKLADSLKASPALPRYFIELVEHGEKSGQLASMFTQLHEHYEQQLSTYLSRYHILLEPLIMLVLGLIVGGLMLSMYLPMFQMGHVL